MILENCQCLHNELPKLIRSNPDRLVMFHTNGDVPATLVIESVAPLIGTHALTIITPKVAIPLLRLIHRGMSQHWITNARILTNEDQQDYIITHLSCADAPGASVLTIHDKRITPSSSLLLMEGKDSTLAITGYLPPASLADLDQPFQLTTHTLFHTHTPTSLLLHEVIDIPLLPFRKHK